MTADDDSANSVDVAVSDNVEGSSEDRLSSFLIQKLRQLAVRVGLFMVLILSAALSELLIKASAGYVVDEPRLSFPYLFAHGVFVGSVIGVGFLSYVFLRLVSRLLGGLQRLPERNDSLPEDSTWEVARRFMPQELHQVETIGPIGRITVFLWLVSFVYLYYPAVVMIHEFHGLLLSFRYWMEELNASLTRKIDHFHRWGVLVIALVLGSIFGFVWLKGVIGPLAGGGVGLVVGNRVNKFLEHRHLRVLWMIWVFLINAVAGVIGGVVAAGPEAFIARIQSVRALLVGVLTGDVPIQIFGALGLGVVGGFTAVVFTPLVLGLIVGGVVMIGLGIPQSIVRAYVSDYLGGLRDAVSFFNQ